MKVLYKKTATGAITCWSIYEEYENAMLVIEFGQAGGSVQTQEVNVVVNQSGRSLKEQMFLEMESRIAKQYDKGYKDTEEEAILNANTNALSLPRPMLAQRFDKVKGIDPTRMMRQYKYDGHRMIVHNDNGKMIAYSRNGKLIDTLGHILKGIDIPEGMFLDGEVYHHGTSLQTITSWCKAKQEGTANLSYVVYDIMSDRPFIERLNVLKKLSLGPYVEVAHSWITSRPVAADLENAIELGYEGLILRYTGNAYEPGKRSKSLIKVKKLIDAEATVIDIEPSKEGWAILVCSKNNKTFKMSAPGTIAEKERVLKKATEYIGREITYQYFSVTDDGLPFHAVARRWREDI